MMLTGPRLDIVTTGWASSSSLPALKAPAASCVRVRPAASPEVRPAAPMSWAWR